MSHDQSWTGRLEHREAVGPVAKMTSRRVPLDSDSYWAKREQRKYIKSGTLRSLRSASGMLPQYFTRDHCSTTPGAGEGLSLPSVPFRSLPTADSQFDERCSLEEKDTYIMECEDRVKLEAGPAPGSPCEDVAMDIVSLNLSLFLMQSKLDPSLHFSKALYR